MYAHVGAGGALAAPGPVGSATHGPPPPAHAQAGSRADVLATTSDYLRIWEVLDGSIALKWCPNAVRAAARRGCRVPPLVTQGCTARRPSGRTTARP